MKLQFLVSCLKTKLSHDNEVFCIPSLLQHTVPYHTLPHYIVPYLTVPYYTVSYHNALYHTGPHHTVPYTIPCQTIDHTIPYCTVQYRNQPYHTVSYHTRTHTHTYRTVPYYTIPYHIKLYQIYTIPQYTIGPQGHTVPYHTIPLHDMVGYCTYRIVQRVPYHIIPYCTLSYHHNITQHGLSLLKGNFRCCSFISRREYNHEKHMCTLPNYPYDNSLLLLLFKVFPHK